MDTSKDKTLIFTLLIVLIASVVAFVAIIRIAYNFGKEPIGDLVAKVSNTVDPVDVDYNFPVIGQAAEVIVVDEKPVVVGSRDLGDDESFDYNFEVSSLDQTINKNNIPQPDSIFEDSEFSINTESLRPNEFLTPQTKMNINIPKIGVEAPVWQGQNGRALLQEGFWMTSSSNDIGQGEVALLCTSKYFELEDFKSCRFLNLLQKDDIINITFADGEIVYTYKIAGINTFSAFDESIYNLAPNDDIIKIVTTPLSTSDERLVVVAKRER